LDDVTQKYEQSLRFFEARSRTSPRHVKVAICLTQLGRYKEARRHYNRALESSFRDRFWHDSSQPNWLVDIYALGNRSDLSAQVYEAVEAYKLDPRAKALWAQYAYAAVRLLTGQEVDVQEYVSELLSKPKFKKTFAIGKTLQAIVDQDQSSFDLALDELLRAHRGQAKFGGLRETPEGYLCLSAMSLSKVALQRGLPINAQSEYLSLRYLDFLLQS
jgi:tetratricopeptide (TPR) repeat protein